MVNFSNIKINKNDNSKQFKGFEITDERITVVNKYEEYINTIQQFADWASNNFYGTNVEQSYYIFEEFVKVNESIIKKIKRIKQ